MKVLVLHLVWIFGRKGFVGAAAQKAFEKDSAETKREVISVTQD